MPDHVDEPARLQVCFLTGDPEPAAVAALDPDMFGPERFMVRGREIYLWLPNGAGRSKLATFAWQRRVGAGGTTRNWRTVLAVRDLLDG
jgi:uncharacterized protein (DUF1697 family)